MATTRENRNEQKRPGECHYRAFPRSGLRVAAQFHVTPVTWISGEKLSLLVPRSVSRLAVEEELLTR